MILFQYLRINFHDSWYLYFDEYRLRKYGLLVSNDLINWADKSDSLEYSISLPHGTVFKVKFIESVLPDAIPMADLIVRWLNNVRD